MKGPPVHQVFGKPADSIVPRIFIFPHSLVFSEEKHHLSGELVSILLSDSEGWPISLWSVFSVGFLCASIQQQSYTQPEGLQGTSAMNPRQTLEMSGIGGCKSVFCGLCKLTGIASSPGLRHRKPGVTRVKDSGISMSFLSVSRLDVVPKCTAKPITCTPFLRRDYEFWVLHQRLCLKSNNINSLSQ